ncbi:hypothetical protein IFU39_13760 [Paenibacillus sp. CFBP 13594]|uniref:hypothetical protein n=1 Tax=Paenibacillus sp. CFBP 13594 TaxID=2774037 RepID=UPI0017806B25|nr:hypothetical protein [Paenibacillus sp. CFBP 13594]MBD8838882.1 hypothetical protein [Paenibacillus sp. CFBP 13594]
METNMYSLSLNFEWKSVDAVVNIETYRFPRPFDKTMNKFYHVPAIYRWKIYKPNTQCTVVYIGETDNLKRRISGYLKPGPSQHTNIRMKALFEQYINDGFIVELDTIQIKTFIFNGIEFEQGSLDSKNIRVLLENLIILDHKKNNYELLNSRI